MAICQLTLERIKALDDGRVQAAFAQELSRAVMDCIDRPGEKKERTVALEFTLTPIVDQQGCLDGVDGEFQVKGKIPRRVSRKYNFQVRSQTKNGVRQGMLVFSDASPTNFDQTTFDDLDDEGRVNRGNPEME